MSSHWTLRRQLTIVTVLFLSLGGAALWLVAQVFQSREGAVVARSQGELATADSLLIKQFRESDFEPTRMSRKQSNAELQQLSTEALAAFSRVEGGFYLLQKDQLLGYAYPTHGGPVTKQDVPQAEQGTIFQLVRRATSQSLPQAKVLHQGSDIVVLRADPLPSWGAVWTMNRIPRSEDANQQLISVLIVLVNLVVGGWTFYIALQLQRGVQQLQHSIKAIEEDKADRIPSLPAEMGSIGEAINTMQRHRQELEQRLRRRSRLASLGQLVAGVAHEVRNPLASMRLNLQYTQRQLQQQGMIMPLKSLLDQVDRLEHLIQRLLYFDQNQWQEDLVTASLEVILEESVSLLRLKAEEQNIQLIYQVSALPLPQVQVRQREIGQVMVNLILNAIQASPEGSQVEVGVNTWHEHLVAWVQDRGPGLTTEEQERVFDPFYSTKPDGTGLGLAISHEIVARHGGYITLQSQPGCTRFSVFLPC
ncbi:MAG: HAMP domain-containing histidine kinase [Chroococcidiopsidaceae cyanobacterium CP_BM_RX_35]|nr:HAMP domain-containing histidine kinase [Chroococcidiopsidaceae cyanobacterium CP_BM_RX_35]